MPAVFALLLCLALVPSAPLPAQDDPPAPNLGVPTAGQQALEFLAASLRDIDRSPVRRRGITMKEYLDFAVERTDAELGGRVETAALEGAVRHALGEMYHQLGDLRSADTQLDKAIEVREKVLSTNHPDVIASLEAFTRVVLDQQQLLRAEIMYNRIIERYQDGYAPDVRGLLEAKRDMAEVLRRSGRPDEGENHLRDALALERGSGRPVDAFTASLLDGIVRMLLEQYRDEDTLAVMRESIDVKKQVFGLGDPRTLEAIEMLSGMLQQFDRPQEALPVLEESAAAHRAHLGEHHPATLSAMMRLGELQSRLGRHGEAEPVYRQVTDRRARLLGEDHPETLAARSRLAICLAHLGRGDEAIALQNETLGQYVDTYGENHSLAYKARLNLARVELASGRTQEARARLERLIADLNDGHPKGHPVTYMAQGDLGLCLMALDAPREAEDALTAAREGLTRSFGGRDEETRRVVEALIELYDRSNRPELANKHRDLLRQGR